MPYASDSFHDRPSQRECRRELRSEATPAERTLWSYLRRSELSGRKFRRQHGAGPYILDFYCPAERLAIELDGYSHTLPDVQEYDKERDAYLETSRIRVLRFRNDEVFSDIQSVLKRIQAAFTKSHPPAPSTFVEGE